MHLVHRAGRDYCVVSNTLWVALGGRFTLGACSGIRREPRASSKDIPPPSGRLSLASSQHRSPSPLPSISCARLTLETPMNRGSGLRIGKILGIPIYLH